MSTCVADYCPGQYNFVKTKQHCQVRNARPPRLGHQQNWHCFESSRVPKTASLHPFVYVPRSINAFSYDDSFSARLLPEAIFLPINIVVER